MMAPVLAFLVGIVAGRRTFTAPAAVSWAARGGAIDVEHAHLGFMGFRFPPWIFTLLERRPMTTTQYPIAPVLDSTPGRRRRFKSCPQIATERRP